MFTPQQLGDAKYLYEQTSVPAEDIAGMLGISRSTLRNRVKEFTWRQRNPRGRSFSPAQLLQRAAERSGAALATAIPGAHPPDPGERATLAKRIQAVIERQIAVQEAILPKLEASAAGDVDGVARTLASLSRSLKEVVMRLDAPPATPEPADDDIVPRDIDELRRALSRKLEALVAEQSAELSGES
jgi:hypothetical protein